MADLLLEHQVEGIQCVPENVTFSKSTATLYFKKRVMGYTIRCDRATGKPIDPFWSDWRLVNPQLRMNLQ